eukprot:171060_1
MLNKLFFNSLQSMNSFSNSPSRLLKSIITRRKSSTNKSLRNPINVLHVQVSKLKQSLRASNGIIAISGTILIIVLLLVCSIYLCLSHHAWEHRTRTIYPNETEPSLLYMDRNIIYTNMGIVIPAKC